jgi:hypothetical protein
MFGLETIIAMNQRAEREVKRRKSKPKVLKSEEQIQRFPGGSNPDGKGYPFKQFGNFVPDGWQQAQEDGEDLVFFVDSSGFGTDHEPALSNRQFTAELLRLFRLRPELGYVITEAGQFQVYVAALEPVA